MPEINHVSRVYIIALFLFLQLTVYEVYNVISHFECFVLLH
jgi:hypothetical protein